jgi:hypothetical protein
MTMLASVGVGSVGEVSVQVMGLDELGVRRLAREARQIRSDALPEHLDYRDDGCDLFPSCLSCPLPRCRYDVPGGVRAMLNQERDHQIRVLREDVGLSVDDIADRFQVSRRTVFRALSLPTRRSERTAS